MVEVGSVSRPEGDGVVGTGGAGISETVESDGGDADRSADPDRGEPVGAAVSSHWAANA